MQNAQTFESPRIAGKTPFAAGAFWRAAGTAVAGGIGVLTLCDAALSGGSEWRSHGLPATAPSTAFCVILLAYGLSAGTRANRPKPISAQVAMLATVLILLLRMVVATLPMGFVDTIEPTALSRGLKELAGLFSKMAPNTAVALLALAGAGAFRWLNRPIISQCFACVSVAISFVVVIGYAYRLPEFYGSMALPTLVAVLVLSSVEIFSCEGGFVPVLTANSEPGRLARTMLVASTAIVFLSGWLVSQYLRNPADLIAVATQTATIVVVTWILVTVGMVRANAMDVRRSAAEESLIRATTTDPLTGLLSRKKLAELASSRSWTESEAIVAKLFIDLDHFRVVNELFGHAVGDSLLIEVARRIVFVAGSHHVGRVGGDEFAIYCTRITPAEAAQIGSEVTEVLAKPFDVGGRSFHLTSSVGIAHHDIAGQADLRLAADTALLVSKHKGGNRATAYEPSMHAARQKVIGLEQDLYAALDHDDELSLVYQPVIRLSDRKLVAVETLARWTHPTLGEISPDRFIKIAETTGLIVPLGTKLMAAAVRQAAVWRAHYPDTCPTVNINVSPVQFASGDVIGGLMHLVREHELPTSGFCIEVTESAFTDENALQALQDAKDAGFKIAIDDFGVGFSCLSQLPRLPLTAVKLDRSFIANAPESTEEATVIAAMIRLAHDLKFTVVAEGVETVPQLDLVTDCDCDYVQGYIFARPLRPEELTAWLAEPENIKCSQPRRLIEAVG